MYKNLVFKEISEYEVQAAYKLEKGYSIQIIKNITEGLHECNLYDSKGNIVDAVEDEDIKGVEFFIEISKDLMCDIEYWDDAINNECELVPLKNNK